MMMESKKQFSFTEALQQLVILENIISEEYEIAIDNISNLIYKSRLEEFKRDHENNSYQLSEYLTMHGKSVPEKYHPKVEWISKGKQFLANLMGDTLLLMALRNSEQKITSLYKDIATRVDRWTDADEILQKHVEHEIYHKEWLDKIVQDRKQRH